MKSVLISNTKSTNNIIYMNNSTSSEQAKIDAEIAVAATLASVKNAAQSVTDSASAVK